MNTLLHLSDIHFGTERAEVMRALQQLAREQRIDSLMLSGDITQRAKTSEFAAARAFINSLGTLPLLAIPGNHDIALFRIWERLFCPYRNYQQAFPTPFDDDGVAQQQWGDVLMLGVNTTRWWRHIDGEVSARQITRVAQLLHDSKGAALKIVACHQPLHVIEAEEEKNLLHGHQAALDAWAQAGADIIAGGHIHQPYTQIARPRADGSALWVMQAGTGTSNRIRDEYDNSVNIVRRLDNASALPDATLHNPLNLQHANWQAERWDFDARSGQFFCHTRSWIK